jgi:hypothetical protein
MDPAMVVNPLIRWREPRVAAIVVVRVAGTHAAIVDAARRDSIIETLKARTGSRRTRAFRPYRMVL